MFPSSVSDLKLYACAEIIRTSSRVRLDNLGQKSVLPFHFGTVVKSMKKLIRQLR